MSPNKNVMVLICIMNVITFLYNFSQSSYCLTYRKARIAFFFMGGGSMLLTFGVILVYR